MRTARACFVAISAIATARPETPSQSQIHYRNTQYKFCLSLPAHWKGFAVIRSQWEGSAITDGRIIAKGPVISIRDPHWKSSVPRQDIPLMVFTHQQWRAVQNGQFNVSAAPFDPVELWHNTTYVFALPPRYNYAFPPGYQEVDRIMSQKPLSDDCLKR